MDDKVEGVAHVFPLPVLVGCYLGDQRLDERKAAAPSKAVYGFLYGLGYVFLVAIVVGSGEECYGMSPIFSHFSIRGVVMLQLLGAEGFCSGHVNEVVGGKGGAEAGQPYFGGFLCAHCPVQNCSTLVEVGQCAREKDVEEFFKDSCCVVAYVRFVLCDGKAHHHLGAFVEGLGLEADLFKRPYKVSATFVYLPELREGHVCHESPQAVGRCFWIHFCKCAEEP